MNTYPFPFHGAALVALPSGGLFWPDQQVLCVSDLHLGKSERQARRGAPALPPYETRDTLQRLQQDMEETGARVVVCLGDSFDDRAAAEALPEAERLWITRLQAGRDWVWIEGNHDPGPLDLGGRHLGDLTRDGLTFRHIAEPAARGEVSGHYHPKARVSARGRGVSRRCFLVDDARLILPAYGTYTGGLRSSDAALSDLMAPNARAILTGPTMCEIPMPRGDRRGARLR